MRRIPGCAGADGFIDDVGGHAGRDPRWTRCQSCGQPSTELYWHMGAAQARFGKVVPRRVSGEKRRLIGGLAGGMWEAGCHAAVEP
ncbi:hypothetical protein GCM10010104_08220 [Streptomyces indiaensis]|uniref:Uncharacterized protein n=1 Tax=Streptomyces indiaensis TaxID=284033 RepID=A0ABP5PZI7_9ACTN